MLQYNINPKYIYSEPGIWCRQPNTIKVLYVSMLKVESSNFLMI
jgi:hypothetical protein